MYSRVFFLIHLNCFFFLRRVLSCGILETPRFGRKSNFLFVPGSSVAFECNDGFVLIGDPRRTCTSEGRWDPAEYGYTECMRKFYYFTILFFYFYFFLMKIVIIMQF